MKIRHILASTLLAGFAALGLAAGLKAAPVREARAEKSVAEWSYVSSETGWAESPIPMEYDDSRPGNAAQLEGHGVAEDELLKFKNGEEWLGYSSLVGGDAKGAFVAGASDNNIQCAIAGSYSFYITTGKQIYVSYHSGQASAKAYIQLQGWTNTYVYAYDETSISGKVIEPFGAFPGKQMEAENVASGVGVIDQHENHLGGLGYIDIPYRTLANTKIIVSNGENPGTQGTTKSSNQDLLNGYYYYNTGAIGDRDLGKVSHLIFGVYQYLKGDGSLCDLTRSQAQSLLDEYNDDSFDETTCQGAFKKCTFNTWANKDKESKANFTGLQVVDQLVWLASTQNPNVLLNNSMKNENATSMIIIIASVTVAIIAAGSVLILRRRKEN